MRARRARQTLIGVAALLASLVPCAVAQADAAYQTHCFIQGTADADVNLVGGTGTYHFTEFTGVCFGQVGGVPLVASPVDITSDGTFDNTVCGTGSATDFDPVVRGGDPGSWAYHIDFVAGHGVLKWTGAGVSGGGYVDIAPDPGQPSSNPPPNGTGCTGGFQVWADVTRSHIPPSAGAGRRG